MSHLHGLPLRLVQRGSFERVTQQDIVLLSVPLRFLWCNRLLGNWDNGCQRRRKFSGGVAVKDSSLFFLCDITGI